jgi:putative toxin-antitoxin system antitoxin component (TIGR02293 family)
MNAEPLAQVYEKLKELRRQGQVLQRTPNEQMLPHEIEHVLNVLFEDNMRISHHLHALLEALTESKEGFDKDGSFIRLLEIKPLANRIFGDEQKAGVWLNRANPSLSGQKPIDLLKDELGTAVVREALEQIDHGIFS